ncbi:MAG: hypothetical protein ACQEQX_03130 [Thermodesulfobacteriota bacterium]
MKSLPLQELKITPFFDLEAFMLLSGRKRIQTDKARELEKLWQEIYKYLHAYQLGEKKGYLVLYLGQEFEERISRIEEQDPEKAQELQGLAQALLMAALLETLPEASYSDCAPVPEPDKVLKRSLQKLGLEFHNSGGLNVRFGLLTKVPFSGDCEQCYIKSSCAKRILQGQG